MTKAERLAKLEEMLGKPEVTASFPSQPACLAWANLVAPLLNFNPQYHEPFMHYLQILSYPISTHTAAPAFQNMLNQVQMAIGELKQDLASVPPVPAVVPEEAKSPSIWKLEPNIYGFGINLPHLWERMKTKWKGKKP